MCSKLVILNRLTTIVLYCSFNDMSNAYHAVSSLYRRFGHECKRFNANHEDMERLSESYFRYRELLHEQERLSEGILRIFGVLGVHSPETSEKTADRIRRTLRLSPREPINSKDVRNRLKLWEILELFLSAMDNTATISDFQDFLYLLDINEGRERVSAQAINSAIKTHPELFQERVEGNQKVVVLRSAGSLKR